MSFFNETPEQEAARINAASGQSDAITAEQVSGNRQINTFLSGLVGRKPDGTSLSSNTTPPDIPQGTATRNTGTSEAGATIDPQDTAAVREDPNKTSSILTFGSVPSATEGGPPFPNVLEEFASYTPLFTLGCLTPNQFNNPEKYRGRPGALTNIVFSSAGRFDAQRVRTAYGSPEYFVDNVVVNTKITATEAAGNTNIVNITFDVYEPYSLGLFIQSLQNAAINAGYPSYFNDTPYLLKLEFMGFKDSGAIFTGTEALAKYLTVFITKVEFTVNEGGSQYKVEAAPAHYVGFKDSMNMLTVDTTITGETVKEMLVSGERSLCTALNTEQLTLVQKGVQQYPDIFAIVFPTDYTDPVGVVTEDEFVEQLKATADPNQTDLRQPLTGRSGQQTEDYGSGEIGRSSMGFGPQSGGNYLFPLETDAFENGRIVRDKMLIDPKQRSFIFKKEQRITEIITKVVGSSEFCVNTIKPENYDAEGRLTWFRIDVQTQLLEYDIKRNVRAKKIIYRIVPYLTSAYPLKNPSSTTAGASNLKKLISKRYNYLYTGQNNDIIKFDIKFDGMFYTGQIPTPLENNANVSNNDTQNAAPNPQPRAEVQTGVAPESAASRTGSASVRPDRSIDVSSASGDKTVEQMVADAFQKAFQNSSKDLINIEVDILGDPFYLSDSGLMAGYFAERGITDQVNGDGTMNWEGGQIYAELIFRNPLEPNLGLIGDGGLYNFPDGGAVSPFSGTYIIHEVINKFSGGVYTQTLKMIRQPNQPEDVPGQAAISKQQQLLYDTTKPQPVKTSPIDATIEAVGGAGYSTGVDFSESTFSGGA